MIAGAPQAPTVKVQTVVKKTKEEKKAEKKANNEAAKFLYGLLLKDELTPGAIICSFIYGASPLMSFLLISQIINNIYSPQAWYFLKVYVGVIAAVGVAAALFRFGDQYLWTMIGARMTTKVKSLLFNNIAKYDIEFYDRTPQGDILNFLSEDAAQIEFSFGIRKADQISYIGQFITGIILAFIYEWRLALLIFAVAPLIVAVILGFRKAQSRAEKARAAASVEALCIAQEVISSIRTVRSFAREDIEYERYSQKAREVLVKGSRLGVLVTSMFTMTIVFIFITVAFVFYWGGFLVTKGELSVGNLFAVYGFLTFGAFGISQIGSTLTEERKAYEAGKRLKTFLDYVPKVPFDKGIEPPNRVFKGKLIMKHVSFKYPTRDVIILKDVSLVLNRNALNAFVGHSGSSKSTVVQLVERFYDVTSGSIEIGGVNIKDMNPRVLHRHIGYVSQEPILFAKTVKENIKYGKRNATDEEMIDAAKNANAHNFIMELPKQYDTLIGEGGSNLSGGQRQRLAIARAILINPSILICDEATSALDAEAEKIVQDALDQVMVGKTSIVIAHRLSTIKHARKIYVFESGRLAESGTHEELLRLNGEYATLIRDAEVPRNGNNGNNRL